MFLRSFDLIFITYQHFVGYFKLKHFLDWKNNTFFFLRGGGNIALTIFAHTFPFCNGCSYFRYLGMGVMVNETCLFRHYYWIVSLILTGSRIQNSTMADWLICFLRLINPFCFYLFCFLEREYCINISFLRTTMLFFQIYILLFNK